MAKDIISAYRNVCREFQGLAAYMVLTEARLRQAHKVVMKGKMPSSEMCFVPLDRALEDYNLAVDEHNETLEAYNLVKHTKEQLERTIGAFSDVEQIVILLHVEQGLSLREIADKTNYSYSHLRNISCAMRKENIA